MVSNIVGPVVRGQDLYGRDDFIKLLSDKLRVGSVLLAAPRRFGKTSVMYRLIDDPTWDYKVIHADLERMIEPAELITHLVEQLVKDTYLSKITNALSFVPKKAWSAVRENIEEVELVKLKLKLKEQLRPNWRESGDELFKRIAESETTVLFILDELPMMIDRMARSKDHREDAITLLRWLRALRLNPAIRNVRFLVAGSIGIDHVLRDLGEISAINDFEKIQLSPFSSKTASAFLNDLADGKALQLSAPAKRRILDLIGTAVPYFIQILFSEVHKAHLQEGEPITPKRVEQVYRDRVLGVECKTYFEHYYGRLRDYYQPNEEIAAKRILRELAMGESLGRDHCYLLYKEITGVTNANIEQFNTLMTNLENDFYVAYEHKNQRYGFSCKLLRDWWLRHYGMDVDGLK